MLAVAERGPTQQGGIVGLNAFEPHSSARVSGLFGQFQPEPARAGQDEGRDVDIEQLRADFRGRRRGEPVEFGTGFLHDSSAVHVVPAENEDLCLPDAAAHDQGKVQDPRRDVH